MERYVTSGYGYARHRCLPYLRTLCTVFGLPAEPPAFIANALNNAFTHARLDLAGYSICVDPNPVRARHSWIDDLPRRTGGL